ncbi:LysR family transcriptional regulator [Aliagarivorans marinus]|uniref:LysR family transcriptional regulator n=1 Tax=Aliagarivorans marinus TaxID=561965 RepID=UPI000424EE11|nr:LysR family transcriptional regulator [Aliagarivorans marinus]
MRLPPLRAIQYFEQVARLNSFSQAAQNLHVTQSAVSHQIRLLEDYLGHSLFVRQGRRLSLTPLGERYYDEISQALHGIAKASQQIVEGSRGDLRLAIYSSLAVKWLIPRLGDFKNQHPEINLSLNMVADDPTISDQLADCFVTISPPSRDAVVEYLYKERLYPMCSPKLWQRLQGKALPDALWQENLLTVQSTFPEGRFAEDWQLWCEQGGFSWPKSPQLTQFSHMLLATEAARYDQGIAFINPYFLDEPEYHQPLVRLPMHDLVTGDSFYFVYKSKLRNRADIRALGLWLKQQCYLDLPQSAAE